MSSLTGYLAAMMFDKEALSVPDRVHPDITIVLSRKIAAIRLLDGDDGQRKSGEIVQLLPGMELHPCGPGYNERTTKVSSGSQFYFVFAEDISLSDPK